MLALVGSPNTGKTSLFNALTGSRQRVGNYAGVTVERREGVHSTATGKKIAILDLPGVRGTDPESARSHDEEVAWSTLDSPDVEGWVAVVDATELARTLPIACSVARRGRPMCVVVTMSDLAGPVDLKVLEAELGVPVLAFSAKTRQGLRELSEAIAVLHQQLPRPTRGWLAPREALNQGLRLAGLMRPISAATSGRAWDHILLHRWWGPLIGVVVFFAVFQAVFTLAGPLQDAIEGIVFDLGLLAGALLGEGPFSDLVLEGAIPGVGAVVVFLPQILLLFACLQLLEDSGYLARAAFLVDRVMRWFGLSGHSALPYLSSFACAIPGVMAARTVESPRHRLLTIFTAPLMACSARLPVYALLIAAFVPRRDVLPGVGLQGLVFFVLYATGLLGALLVARLSSPWVESLAGLGPIKKSSSANAEVFVLDLPSYKWPALRNLGIVLWQRAATFLRRAGTLIFGLSALLWFMVTYPKTPEGKSDLNHSMAGRVGAMLAPALEPLGFDWRISVALVPGLAAREVMVSSMATVFAVETEPDSEAATLETLLPQHYSLATALALLAWYVFAPQCLATIAVVRRESGSVRFALVQTLVFLILAYCAALGVYQLSRLLGWG